MGIKIINDHTSYKSSSSELWYDDTVPIFEDVLRSHNIRTPTRSMEQFKIKDLLSSNWYYAFVWKLWNYYPEGISHIQLVLKYDLKTYWNQGTGGLGGTAQSCNKRDRMKEVSRNQDRMD